MTKNLLTFLLICVTITGFAQDKTTVKGKVIDASTTKALESVNIVNLNQVKGTSSNSEGEFEISAKANDTLHLSYLGFKSIKVRVTNDWIKFGESTIELTELALALEEVVVNQLKLTGYLEVDINQVPIQSNFQLISYIKLLEKNPMSFENSKKCVKMTKYAIS